MTDPATAAITALLHGDLMRFPIVILAGVITSAGPCVAPRYIALASVIDGPRRSLTILAFTAGIVTVYAALGGAAGVLGAITRNASALDLVLGTALAAGGLATLLRRSQHHDHEHAHEKTAPARRLSGIFCLGAASALVISPCCTPIVAAAVAFPALDSAPLTRAALLGAFAIGHATPLLLFGSFGSLIAKRVQRWTASPAPAVVSGSLMLGLGAYYGLLA